MKILQIAGGGDRGGAKTHILGLCSRLKERCDLTLLSLRSGEFPLDSEAAGIPTKTIFSRNPLKDYCRGNHRSSVKFERSTKKSRPRSALF